jgi:hypothetical protein
MDPRKKVKTKRETLSQTAISIEDKKVNSPSKIVERPEKYSL